MPLEWIIFQIFINTVEVGVLFYLLCNKFAAKGNKTFIPTLLFIAWTVVVLSLRIFIRVFEALPIIEMFIIMSCFAFLYFFREGKILRKLFWVLTSSALLFAIAFISIATITLIAGVYAVDIMIHQPSTERLIVMIISKTLQIVIFYLLAKLKGQSEVRNLLSGFPLMICFIIPFISTIFMMFMFILLMNDVYITTELKIPMTISYLVINIIVFALYEIISREAKKNYMLVAKNKQYVLMEQHNKQVIEMYDKMSEWRHDYNGHMQLILGMLKKNDTGDNRAAINYIEELGAKIESSSLEIVTGNTVVDAIVSAKAALALSYGITFEHSINLTVELTIDNTDLCSILSNLLDNAIEACCKLSENRYINIEMLIFRNQFNIKVINSTNGEYKIENGKLKTIKSGELHGIGMGHVKFIVESYGGIFDIKPEASSFTTHISIPLLK